MKKLVVPMILVLLLLPLIGFAAEHHGDESHSDSEKVRGEVVDLACYLDHGAQGLKHKACALACVKGGQPMGLLTEDGTVFLLVANHDDGKAFEEAKEFAAFQVEVTGRHFERAGIKAIEVGSVQKLDD